MDKNSMLNVPNKIIGDVTTDGWGKVFLRSLSLSEIEKFETYKEQTGRGLAYLIAVGVCDEDGKRIFTEADIDSLLALPLEVTLPVGQALAKHLGITVARVEDAKKN